VRFLLDTNVVSELRKRERADSGLRQWFAAVEREDLALSVLVLGELRLGIFRLGRRDPQAAAHLEAWLARLERSYQGRLLAIDSAVVEAWARLNVSRPLPVIDSLQAATALVHGLTLVTRDVDDLAGVEVPLLNPFVD
jgi:predicted nucleic acid-binding protein